MRRVIGTLASPTVAKSPRPIVPPRGCLPRARRSAVSGVRAGPSGRDRSRRRSARRNRTLGFRHTTTAASAGSLLARATDSSKPATFAPLGQLRSAVRVCLAATRTSPAVRTAASSSSPAAEASVFCHPAEDAAQLVATAAHLRLRGLPGRGQRPPTLDDHREGEGRIGPIQDIPEVLAEPGADTLTPGDLRQTRRPEAQPVAEAELPGHEHGPRIAVQAERPGALAGGRAEAVLAVDRLDPRDRGELAPGLARVGEEPEGPRADHGVVGDGLGGLEVSLERRVLHELRAAGVGEPLASDGVADEVVGDPKVEPGQVAEGIRVLGTRQPPDHDRPGVALVFLDESSEPRLDVPDGLLPLRAARLRLVLRGHLPLAEHPDDLLPVLEAAPELRRVRHRLEVDPRLGLAAAVTFQAILSDQPPQSPTGLVGPRAEGGRDGEQPDDQADPPTASHASR